MRELFDGCLARGSWEPWRAANVQVQLVGWGELWEVGFVVRLKKVIEGLYIFRQENTILKSTVQAAAMITALHRSVESNRKKSISAVYVLNCTLDGYGCIAMIDIQIGLRMSNLVACFS